MGCSFGFRRGHHDFTSIKVLKITALGEARTFSLNTTSFLVFQIFQRAPTQMISVTFCFFPWHPSMMSAKRDVQLVGVEGQSRQVRRKDQRKIDSGHWNRIWSAVSSLPHTKHSSGPDHFFYFNCTPDWILSWYAIQRKILTFNGMLHLQINIILVSITPPVVNSFVQWPHCVFARFL